MHAYVWSGHKYASNATFVDTYHIKTASLLSFKCRIRRFDGHG